MQKQKLWVSKKFAEQLREGHRIANDSLQKSKKEISFLDYTEFLADMMDLNNKAIQLGINSKTISVMPFKKGNKSKKVSFEFDRI
jgi:hypothetical protein